MTFTIFDIIIFIILTIYSVIGVYNGLAKVTLNFIAFTTSIIAAYLSYPLTQQLLIEYFLLSNEIVISILAGMLAYFPCLIAASFITARLHIIIKGLINSLVDRVLGFFAGFMKGWIICLVMFMLTAIITTGSYIQADTLYDIASTTTSNKYPNWLRNSYTCPYLDKLSRNVILLFSEETLKSFKLPNPPTVNESIEFDRSVQSNQDSTITTPPIDDEELTKELKEVIK